jgi:hypothetical protein
MVLVASASVEAFPLTQAKEVKLLHVPERSWIRAPSVLKLAPMLLNEIFTWTLCAVNLYHTSAPGVPAQVLATAGEEAVVYAKFPAVLLQEVSAIRVVACTQSSLTSGTRWVTQILKVQLQPVGSVVVE